MTATIKDTTTTVSHTTRMRAAIVGILLALVVTHPAAAATWSGDAQLTATGNYQPRILRTGGASAISIWQYGQNVYGRRTGDGGTTWAPTQTLVTGIWFTVSASSSGANVDLAYVKKIRNADGSTSRRLYYKRSTNGGASWGSARAMTSTGSNIGDQAIARHSNGQVSIAWIGLTSGNIYMRTSIDSGATFSGSTLRRAQQELRGRPDGRYVPRRPPARDRDRRDVHRLHLGPRHARRPPDAQPRRQLDVRQGAQHVRRVRLQPRRIGEQGRHRLHELGRAR